MGTRKPNDPALYFETHVFVCTNRRPDGHPRGSCAQKGAEALRDYAKAHAKALGLRGVRVNAAGCLDRCEHGPCLLIYPEGIWYHAGDEAAMAAILEQHVRDGERVAELIIPDRVSPSDATGSGPGNG